MFTKKGRCGIISYVYLKLGSELQLSKKIYIETYGCQQNVSDSEKLSGMAIEMGYEPCECKEEADLIVYNTCAVRENAELKVYGNIGALKALKRKNENLIIAVCGCMMQEAGVAEKIKKSYRHVDIVFGTHALHRFKELVRQAEESRDFIADVENIDGEIREGLPIERADGVCASVSIMYGCNNFCTYCIVPYVRGRERSRKKEDILGEIEDAVSKGYKEIMLLGQNVNSYGKGTNVTFAQLLDDAAQIDGVERIRFMTSHPKDISEELLKVMGRRKNICKQLHLPVQCGNNRVLKAMNRGYTREKYLALVEKAREYMPEITISTDIIVGFPGETTEEFEDTLDLLERVRYDTVFSFIYSKRRGTPAAVMADVISEEEKKNNFNRLLDVQNRICAEINGAYLGKVLPVLVEGVSKTDPNALTGRTDGGKLVHFAGDKSLTGKIVNIKITEPKTWSLMGELYE